MTPEQLIKSWHDDSAEHGIVFCHDWASVAMGDRHSCEACGRLISVWPVLIAVAGQNPLLHLICRRSCLAIAVKCGPVPFGGHIEDNVLPGYLERFRA